jgi:hypothetical protein
MQICEYQNIPPFDFHLVVVLVAVLIIWRIIWILKHKKNTLWSKEFSKGC